jgi:hypothetical protein
LYTIRLRGINDKKGAVFKGAGVPFVGVNQGAIAVVGAVQYPVPLGGFACFA